MVTDTMTRLNHLLSNLCCAGSILVVEKCYWSLSHSYTIGDTEHWRLQWNYSLASLLPHVGKGGNNASLPVLMIESFNHLLSGGQVGQQNLEVQVLAPLATAIFLFRLHSALTQ